MEVASIKAETRSPGGRHANERLRRRGMVPAVIYGHGETPETVALSLRELELALEAAAHVVRLELGDSPQQYLIKDVQFDHLQKSPLHVDLVRVDASERVTVKVRVELRGEPAGVKEGGVLMHQLTDVEVECGLLEIPEIIRVNIAGLGLNQAIHIRDLELAEGVRPLHGPDEIVAQVRPHRGDTTAEIAPTGEETTKEPEVFGRVAKEEPGEGAE